MEFMVEEIMARFITEEGSAVDDLAFKFQDDQALVFIKEGPEFLVKIERISPTDEEGVFLVSQECRSVWFGYVEEPFTDPAAFLKKLSEISLLDFAVKYPHADSKCGDAMLFAELFTQGEI
ncbi:hypothetical protein [Evansella clarkii]|uniref:hypothetical protein n=1 Tax=Evansella clarkii TaxID=79879 RepID=UPI000B452AAF|nr:hypothetical protein [Evansella clarkii]